MPDIISGGYDYYAEVVSNGEIDNSDDDDDKNNGNDISLRFTNGHILC